MYEVSVFAPSLHPKITDYETLSKQEPNEHLALEHLDSDQLCTVENSIGQVQIAIERQVMERQVMERQAQGRYFQEEVAEILAQQVSNKFPETWIEGEKNRMYGKIYTAFMDGKLRFYRVGMPLTPLSDSNEWFVHPLRYGEYTFPKDVNKWLSDVGAEIRFPESLAAESTSNEPESVEANSTSNETEVLLGKSASSKLESKEQRQDRRLQACIDAGLQMQLSHLSRLPDGIGKLAEKEGIKRQSFSADVKAALERKNSHKKIHLPACAFPPSPKM